MELTCGCVQISKKGNLYTTTEIYSNKVEGLLEIVSLIFHSFLVFSETLNNLFSFFVTI